MAKKEREPDKPPSKAYLVSFGDTMTTLLAFFIVLNSLAEDQTGANLHAGTGSFVQALQNAGLPGNMQEDSANAIQHEATPPVYIPEHEPKDDSQAPTYNGSDETDNGIRSIDREAEDFQRFLNEMEQFADVEQLPEVEGEVQFDFFNQLQAQSPYLGGDYATLIRQVVPLLKKGRHRIDVIVWVTTPSESAWQRAADQAVSINNELAQRARLKPEQLGRLVTLAQPWGFVDIRRPVISVVVRKQQG